MGGGESKEVFPESKHFTVLDYGYCRVWKRKDSGLETMEQYDIAIENEQALSRYKHMWALRTQEKAVVEARYFTHRSSREICGMFQQGSVLIERIPYRLSQFSGLPYDESIAILRRALRGFRVLHGEYGLFQVRSTMICINSQREIKVWHHTDLSAADPENPNCRSLADMIDSIVGAVEINADFPSGYCRFSEFLRVNRGKVEHNYEDILRVLSSYAKANRITRKEGLPRLADYLRQAEGWEEYSYNANFLNNLGRGQIDNSQMGKFSFRESSHDENESVASSRKTLKNTPSFTPNFNVYTHKEVNEILSREKRQSRSQKAEPTPPKAHKFTFTSKLMEEGPQSPQSQQRPTPSVGKPPTEPVAINRIEFKIASGRNFHFKLPHSDSLKSMKSLNSREGHSPPPTSIYTQQPVRGNRFTLPPSQHDSRSVSRSPASSLAFSRP